MTSHVLPVYVIDEGQVIEQELLAEVTVWMWHDLSMPLVSNVAVFNMTTKLLNVIQSLLPNENSSSFETNLAESSIMRTFHMPLQGRFVWKLLPRVTIMNQTIQRTEMQACLLSCFTMEIDCIILWVFLAILLDLLIEKAPGKVLIVGDDDLIEVGITHGALLGFQNESHTQRAGVADVCMTAWTKSEEFDFIEAQYTALFFPCSNTRFADSTFFAESLSFLTIFHRCQFTFHYV